MLTFEIHPVTAGTKSGRFDLFEDLVTSLEKSRTGIDDGDVIVISSKYVSNAQGRIIDLKDIQAYPDGKAVAAKHGMQEELAEIITRESDQIFGGIAGFVMSGIDDILAPNAGIDRSNSRDGTAVLYPNDPYQVAEYVRRMIFLRFAVNTGVIITDSRLMPARTGTVGVALSCAGMEPVTDMRAQKDLNGNPLKVTIQATADGLATAANHKMGEGAESTPYVVIKGSGARLTGRGIHPGEMAIAHEQCVYVRSLRRAEF